MTTSCWLTPIERRIACVVRKTVAMRYAILGGLAVLLLARASFADPIVAIGDIQLLPDTANQQRTISVSGGELIQGANFYIRIGDGMSVPNGPVLTGLDLVGTDALPTIFHSNNTHTQGDPSLDVEPYFAGDSITTASGSVAASGTLAILTFDTTHVTAGSWPLILMDPGNTATDFCTRPAAITNGTVSIMSTTTTPEPTSLIALVSCGICLLGFRRCRRLFR
jgi:hypothetical protein